MPVSLMFMSRWSRIAGNMSSIGIKKQCEKKILEARGGIEPPIMVLQTIALPLGDRATALRSCQFSVISGQLIRKNNQESTELNEIWTGEARRECSFPRPVLYLELHLLLLLMDSPYGRFSRKRALLVGCGGQLR